MGCIVSLFRRDILLLFLGFMLGVLVYFLLSALFFSPVIIPLFSPYAESKVIDAINNAEKSIDIEMYVLTSDEVINALKAAHDRGVKIRIILEKRVMGGENSEPFDILKDYGIDVKWASNTFKLTHSKLMIVDGKIVLVGSHNFSKNALTLNREASVMIEKSPAAIGEFKKVFEEDWTLAHY